MDKKKNVRPWGKITALYKLSVLVKNCTDEKKKKKKTSTEQK